jgi:hypothetical protein
LKHQVKENNILSLKKNPIRAWMGFFLTMKVKLPFRRDDYLLNTSHH